MMLAHIVDKLFLCPALVPSNEKYPGICFSRKLNLKRCSITIKYQILSDSSKPKLNVTWGVSIAMWDVICTAAVMASLDGERKYVE